MNKRRILLTDFDRWSVESIYPTGEEEEPRRLDKEELSAYVASYLKSGRGLLIKRLISVLTRLFTATLQPSQVPSQTVTLTLHEKIKTNDTEH